MKRLGSVAVAALSLASATPALALEFGNGFSIVGDVQLEFVQGDGDSAKFGFGDVTMGWRSTGGVGVEFGIVAVDAFTSHSDETALWGALVLETGFGEVKIGRPRPLLAKLSTAPEIGATDLLDEVLFAAINGSIVDFIGLYQNEVDIYGVTFEGEAGAFTYGAGYHSLRAMGESIDILELTATYSVDNVELYAGMETGDFVFDTYRKVILGGRYSQDRWAMGVEVVNVSQFISSSDQTFTRVFGEYEVLDNLTLGVQYQDFDNFGDGLVGLSGIYTFGIGGFAELGYVSDNDGDSLTSASIGFRF